MASTAAFGSLRTQSRLLHTTTSADSTGERKLVHIPALEANMGDAHQPGVADRLPQGPRVDVQGRNAASRAQPPGEPDGERTGAAPHLHHTAHPVELQERFQNAREGLVVAQTQVLVRAADGIHGRIEG